MMPYAPEHKVPLSANYDREFSFARLSAFLGYDYQAVYISTQKSQK